MAAPKGTRPPAAGIGKKPGTLNHNTKLVKDMVAKALEMAGGETYLLSQAKDNPTAFLTLVGKLIPVQLGGDPNGVPVALQEVRRVIVDKP